MILRCKWRTWLCAIICIITSLVIVLIYQQFYSKARLPPGGHLCIKSMGGMGNLMFQYASAYGIAEDKGMALLMSKTEELWDIFPGLTAFKIQDSIHCRQLNVYKEIRPCAFDEETFDFPSSERVQIEGYLQSWKYFSHVESDIKKQFMFKTNIIQEAKSILAKIKRHFQKRDVYKLVTVGVHVRRTDMLANDSLEVGYVVPGKAFIHKAMNYFRHKHRSTRPIFVVTSDDGNWTNANMRSQDVVVVLSNPPEVDMALLSLCDHHIITIGTFGWWAAFLGNGTTVYYGQSIKPGSWLDKYAASDPNQTHYFPPHWIAMT